MNTQLKTVLLTVLTLSVLTIALVELSGVSSNALFNKYHIGQGAADRGPGTAAPGMGQSEAEKRQVRANALPKTVMSFTDTKFDFGKINEGSIVKHAYHFKNTGNAPLLIVRAEVSCGCTVPSFPQDPIPPGGEGDIMVQFDSHNKKGIQHKNIIVTSNSEQEKMSIGFVAEVE